MPPNTKPPLPEPPKDADNFEKVKPEDCTHTGYYVPFGMDSFPITNAMLISHGTLCMRCGKLFFGIVSLDLPKAEVKEEKEEKSGIIKPN